MSLPGSSEPKRSWESREQLERQVLDRVLAHLAEKLRHVETEVDHLARVRAQPMHLVVAQQELIAEVILREGDVVIAHLSKQLVQRHLARVVVLERMPVRLVHEPAKVEPSRVGDKPVHLPQHLHDLARQALQLGGVLDRRAGVGDALEGHYSTFSANCWASKQSSAALNVCSCVIAFSVRSRQSRMSCPKNGKPTVPWVAMRFSSLWFTR